MASFPEKRSVKSLISNQPSAAKCWMQADGARYHVAQQLKRPRKSRSPPSTSWLDFIYSCFVKSSLMRLLAPSAHKESQTAGEHSRVDGGDAVESAETSDQSRGDNAPSSSWWPYRTSVKRSSAGDAFLLCSWFFVLGFFDLYQTCKSNHFSLVLHLCPGVQ